MSKSPSSYIETSLLAMFTDLHAGLDVAPGTSLRLEGYMQAIIHAGAMSRAQLEQLMARCYESVYGEPIPPLFPPCDDDSLIPIPCHMKRAPVKRG